MKKLIVLLIFASLFIGNVAFADTSLTVSWQVLDSKIRPGSSTTVILTLTNPSLTLGVSSIKLYINPGLYLTTSTLYQEIGGIGAGASQQTSLTVSASPSAISTNSYIAVRVVYSTDSTSKETNINVPISIRRLPILQITNVKYSKDVIEPGSTVQLSFDVSNNGDGAAKDVRVVLNQSQNIFTAVGSGENYIPNINPGGVANTQFALTINPSASISTYTIPVALAYYDELRNDTYTASKNIGLTISGKYNFIVTVDTQDVITPGMSGSVIIKIANAGTQDAYFLYVNAFESQDLKQITPATVYVGKLGSDDYDTQKFSLRVDSSATSGDYPLRLQLKYKDPFGNSYSEFYDTMVKVHSQAEIPRAQPPSTIIIAVIFVAAVVGYFAYRKIKKK